MQESQQISPAGDRGFSLFEILVVLGIFTIIMVVATQTLTYSLLSVHKSEATFKVRENINQAITTIERHLRNTNNVTCTASPPGITYTPLDRATPTSFSCQSIGPTGFVASGSARLTSTDVRITSCSFACTPATDRVPPSVTISLTAQDSQNTGRESANISTTTTIYLRAY